MKRVVAVMLAGGVLLGASWACSDPETRPTVAAPTPRPRPLPPVARSSAEVDPSFDTGQQIFITDDGFKPRQLIAIVSEEISWINETGGEVSVRFVNGQFESGPIRPGRAATYTPPTAISIVYELQGHPEVQGAIQVEPYFDPGEDPAAEDRQDADTPLPGHRRRR